MENEDYIFPSPNPCQQLVVENFLTFCCYDCVRIRPLLMDGRNLLPASLYNAHFKDLRRKVLGKKKRPNFWYVFWCLRKQLKLPWEASYKIAKMTRQRVKPKALCSYCHEEFFPIYNSVCLGTFTIKSKNCKHAGLRFPFYFFF